MKKQLSKYDFLAINRAMNQNYNAKCNPILGSTGLKNITKGEELKLNRKEREAKGKRK